MNYFAIGTEKYKAKDYIGALQYFELNLQEKPDHIYSIFNLIQIYMRLNNFKKVREIYAIYYPLIKDYKVKIYNELINLESSESNYLEALKLAYEYIEKSNDLFSLKDLAKIHMNLGNFTVAQKIYETLMLSENERLRVQSLIFLSQFYIQMGDYEKANYYCNLVDFDIYTKYYPLSYYFNVKRYLDASLGIVSTNYYVPNIIKTHDEKLLIDHIKEHCNQTNKYTTGCFLENIDISVLLEEVKRIIPTINGIYNNSSHVYYYHFNKPIGFIEEETNDLCIIKHCDGQILSMFPCRLSDNFNKEGWLTSEKLRLKRERGIKNAK